MPKQRRRKCSEPRCCWHWGSKGRTSEGEGLGARGPSRKTKRCLEESRKKLAPAIQQKPRYCEVPSYVLRYELRSEPISCAPRRPTCRRLNVAKTMPRRAE